MASRHEKALKALEAARVERDRELGIGLDEDVLMRMLRARSRYPFSLTQDVKFLVLKIRAYATQAHPLLESLVKLEAFCGDGQLMLSPHNTFRLRMFSRVPSEMLRESGSRSVCVCDEYVSNLEVSAIEWYRDNSRNKAVFFDACFMHVQGWLRRSELELAEVMWKNTER